jgi:osmotically-inducible protein OsmY
MKPIISDTILRDAVVKELECDPEVAAKHISVTAIDGAITLGGHVMRDHEKHVAMRAAERVPAAGAVADDIEVRPPSLHEHADDEIAEEVAHLRGWGAQIPIPDSVAAQVRDGHVILHGQVESASQRDAAESAVRQLTGVRVVDNLIKVKPQTEPTAADVERRVQEAITRMADLHARSIRVTMNDGTAHLHGHVPSLAALQTALQVAETAPGHGRGERDRRDGVTTRSKVALPQGATLRALDEGSVAQIPGVQVAQKGNFVGVVAPRSTTPSRQRQPSEVTWDQPPMLPEDGYLNRKNRRTRWNLSHADVHHRFLRPELRLDGFPHPQRAHVPRPRRRHRDCHPPRAPRILQTPRLVLRPDNIEEMHVRSSQRRRRR